MADLPFLDRYCGQTTDELIALEGQYRTDSLVAAFEEALRAKVDRIGADQLTEEERVILSVESLERQVNNGGYDQFFLNTPEYAPVVVAALQRIGCTAVATLTEEAIKALGISGSLRVEAIEQALHADDETRSEKLEECDKRYYKVAGDLAVPLLEFIKQNREKIDLQPQEFLDTRQNVTATQQSTAETSRTGKRWWEFWKSR